MALAGALVMGTKIDGLPFISMAFKMEQRIGVHVLMISPGLINTGNEKRRTTHFGCRLPKTLTLATEVSRSA